MNNAHEFVELQKEFTSLAISEKILRFVWYLHQKGVEDVNRSQLLNCFNEAHIEPPSNVNTYLSRFEQSKPKRMLKNSKGYRLSAIQRSRLSEELGQLKPTHKVELLLVGLPARLSTVPEQVFLEEAISCIRVGAFRAAVVMSWNLAYDHLMEYIMTSGLAKFNAQIPLNYKGKSSVSIAKKEDFGDYLKESEVIEIAKSSGLITGNVKKVLSEKLTKRNLAAHPSSVLFTKLQAEEFIHDIVENMILKL